MTSLLTLSGVDSCSVDAASSAVELRDTLALNCGSVRNVINAAQAEHAAAVLREVKGFTRLIEDSRKLVKEPVLSIGKQIDAKAKELTDFLEAEAVRISKLLGAFQNEQARIAREEAAKAAEEERRIREEAAAKIADAELHSRNTASMERKIEKIESKAFDAIANTRAAAVMAAAPKLSGIAGRTVTKFEVEDLHALYRAMPALVVLQPNTAAINAILRGSPGITLPGLRTYIESMAVVR